MPRCACSRRVGQNRKNKVNVFQIDPEMFKNWYPRGRTVGLLSLCSQCIVASVKTGSSVVGWQAHIMPSLVMRFSILGRGPGGPSLLLPPPPPGIPYGWPGMPLLPGNPLGPPGRPPGGGRLAPGPRLLGIPTLLVG